MINNNIAIDVINDETKLKVQRDIKECLHQGDYLEVNNKSYVVNLRYFEVKDGISVCKIMVAEA